MHRIMKKITYRPVYNRKNRLNGQGTALLQVEAYLEKKKIYFSSHIYLTPEQWDTKRRMIIRHPHAESLNYMLRDFIIELERRELELWKSGYEITLDLLRKEFRTETSSSFLQFIKEDVQNSQSKESTKKNRMSTYLLLSKYKPGLTFKDIDKRFVYDFERFLYDCDLQMNTVAKHMKHLKAFVNSAIDKGYLSADDYAFRRYRIKTREFKHSFLLPEEIQKLEELSLTGRRRSLTHTLDAFLFCCYTGLRYSDFTNLSEKNIQKINGKPWIIFHSVKTGTEVKLPLTLLFDGKAWQMLRKYGHDLPSFFSLKSNSGVNKELIRIGRLAKIDKHFSFHSARHTNATLLIDKGANMTTVQKLLGHRNISTTQIYSEVMESTLVKDLKKCSRNK